MSQFDILSNQLNQAIRLNNYLSNSNSSLLTLASGLKQQNEQINSDYNTAKIMIQQQQDNIVGLNNSIIELKRIIDILIDENERLIADNMYLQKKNILDKIIALTKENIVLLTQIVNNLENYSTDFQKIFYKQQQLMQIKNVNFYLLITYYLFFIILVYFTFFNKNNFTIYFKVSWILFLAILPLLSFIIIDIKLQTLKFLWSYIISFMYGHSFYSTD
jgi:pheromone shutdown protein TraB